MADKTRKGWNPASKWRWSIAKKITALANRLRVEAVFPEDFKDVEALDEVLRYLNAQSLTYLRGRCPICGEPTITEAEVEPACFNGVGDAPMSLGKIEGLLIRRCENCHAYCIVGW